jgi:hypothetical protein
VTRPGGGYAVAIVASLLCWGVALLIATAAFGYDDADFCRDSIAADRMHCHATHAADLADCAFTRAVERWLGVDDAQRNATECRNDAQEACVECKRLADECGVVQ